MTRDDKSTATAWGQFIAGRWEPAERSLDVRNPLDGTPFATVALSGRTDVTRAIDAAQAALAVDFPAHRRYEVLMRAADLVDRYREQYADAIAHEGSKTIREARREPPRAATLLRLSAEEAHRIAGETLPFDARPGSERRVGYFTRVPAGIVGVITPFNDPLAVAVHKLGPALAAGNAVVAKAAPASPLSVLRLAHHLAEAGLPPGRLNAVSGGAEIGDALVTDSRVRIVSFTGGVATGREISRRAGIKKLLMELGSNSPVIVMPDARLDHALAAVVDGAFAQAGQNCLGVQRVFVHEQIYDLFRDRIVEAVRALRVGSSLAETTDVCAVMNEEQADRIENWIAEATGAGARILAGGQRQDTLVWPTVLENVPEGTRLDQEEAYGPVVSLYCVASLDAAIARANAVPYGLHAAIFTESLRDAFTAIERLQVGGVIVNDSTDYRFDPMPFGGTKLSGIGREGIRHAVVEMTEPRVVCLNLA